MKTPANGNGLTHIRWLITLQINIVAATRLYTEPVDKTVRNLTVRGKSWLVQAACIKLNIF